MVRHKISDEDLLNELKTRFEERKKTLQEQEALMAQLSAVNKKLLASEQLKSNFLSNIRNEINNPITATLELSKNIAEGNLDANTITKFANLIYSETFNLDFQLRNIFLSAELEAGEAQLSVISVDVSSVIDNIIKSFKHESDKKGIHLNFKNNLDNQQLFHTDTEKLFLIISNLLSNAIKYSHNNSCIEVCCTIENNQLVIAVKDEGIGISMKDTSVIYDRFRQLDEGPCKSYPGQGLGLSITKALLEMISGEILLESTIGVGSTFTIRVNELEVPENNIATFSSDGNDFLFEDNDDMIF